MTAVELSSFQMIELRHLRVATTLAEELHFGRTGQRLRLAQSAVSTVIKSLEEELGETLFERTRRSVRITPAGDAFVEGARRVLAELAQTSARVSAAASGDSGRLAVRFVGLASLAGIPRMIETFRREHPRIAVTAEVASSEEQLAALRDGRCDVAFVPLAASKRGTEGLACHVVMRSPLVVLVPRNHRLATRRWIRLEELAADRFAFLGELGESRTSRAFRQRCVAAGFDPEIVLEVDHGDTLRAFVAAGFAVAVVPELVCSTGGAGIARIALRPAHEGGIAAMWNPAMISPAGRRFVELMPGKR